MPTSKSLRAAPQKNLRDYVVSINKIFSDPDSLPDSVLQYGNFVAEGNNLSSEITNYVNDISLGFKLTLNNVTYEKISITASGWALLQDPNGFGFTPWYWDVLSPQAGSTLIYENEKIDISYRRNHVIIAPWFDFNIPVASSISVLNTSGIYNVKLTPSVVSDVQEGINVDPWPFSFTDRGTRYVKFYDKNFGRGFKIRWSTFRKTVQLKFEASIYENGRIDFRYWPLKNSQELDVLSLDPLATCGIFWGSDQFRDFAALLDYSRDQREILEIGGSQFDSAYSEFGKRYSHRITKSYWPKNGAVITFSPPTSPYKVLPQKTVKQINASKTIIKRPGIFDDRRSVIFSGSTNIFYPTTLPSRLIGDTGDVDVSLRQILYTSSSIKSASGSINKAAVDTFLTQIEGISHDFYKKDLSFNEYQKDYKVTDPTLPFFATGSSLEIFGEGFTTSLKSKTQFHFSLPVQELTLLPATRSCVLYYDHDKKQWINNTDGQWRPPESVSIDYINNSFPYEKDDEFYYRVTETSRMFDAVGRKITLSSNRRNSMIGSTITETYQRDDIIGLIVNTDDPLSQSKLNESLSREYPASFTDSDLYNPTNGQKIKLPIDYPFLIEKIVVEFPFYATNEWFKDRTTCKRAHIYRTSPIEDEYAGPIDFGGPGITFSVLCARKCLDFYKMDLIASGTITHQFDDVKRVLLRAETEADNNWSLRPEGFRHFSNPTTVLSGTFITGFGYYFNNNVRLEMEAAVSSGITYSRNERRPFPATVGLGAPIILGADFVNRRHAVDLLTKQTVSLRGEDVDSSYTLMKSIYNTKDIYPTDANDYNASSPRIHVHEVHPLSRGATGIYFNGNSILGGTIASSPTNTEFPNQLLVTSISSSLPLSYKTEIDKVDFRFDAVSMYSTFSSKPAPYLIMPGETLTFAVSKTRPAIGYANLPGFSNDNPIFNHTTYILTGSHETTALSPGNFKVTIYGSYVREGMEYHL